MTDLYLDANILISHLISNHIFHQKAFFLLNKATTLNYIFCLSPLTFDEFWHGLLLTLRLTYTKVRNNSSSFFYPYIERANSSILSWKNLKLVSISFSSDQIHKTAFFIKKYNLKPRDAFHLIYCLENNIKYLVSFDEELKKKIKEVKVIGSEEEISKI